jgi:hypothetical protein
VRTLRNRVIRSNFGLKGLRLYRQYAREKRVFLRWRYHALRQLAALRLNEVGFFDRLLNWNKRRKLRAQVAAYEKQAFNFATKQLLLLNPAYAQYLRGRVIA